ALPCPMCITIALGKWALHRRGNGATRLGGGPADYGLREIATGLSVMVTQGLVLLKEFAAVVRQSVRKRTPIDEF
ncbi:hypothetical protein, partial [Xylella fastidiosa]|uniref:hypothetical protein n=1 Tax=Xylella fastidiosa TaxID=2371 RepID=UPI001F3880D1